MKDCEMNLYVTNETAPLEAVVLGIGTDLGKPRGINPMSRFHLKNNTYPTESAIRHEIQTLHNALTSHGVRVYRPENLSDTEQIFTRDIGFVIDEYFFIANMRYKSRSTEIEGLRFLMETMDPNKIIAVPEEAVIEGGDVILWNDYVFVGLGDRTNDMGLRFLQEFFPHKEIIGFDLVVDQASADNNVLHLDCAFQPIGPDQAIFYPEGFSNRPDVLFDLFPEGNRIEVSLEEKNQMYPNIFSVSPTKIVVEAGFTRLKAELKHRGFEVIEVDYSETSKLSGLLRCSTLPLRRSNEN